MAKEEGVKAFIDLGMDEDVAIKTVDRIYKQNPDSFAFDMTMDIKLYSYKCLPPYIIYDGPYHAEHIRKNRICMCSEDDKEDTR